MRTFTASDIPARLSARYQADATLFQANTFQALNSVPDKVWILPEIVWPGPLF